ncbi:MAG: hypothetical protein NT103_05425 [Campylobacterales bacterium]|nr:hypothetical protein [Campylobacterales bacterium]
MKFLPFLSTIMILVSIAQCDSMIDTQIDQIMKAPANERYELMNQLKTKIALMNENERNEALQKLQGGMGAGMGKGSQNNFSGMPMQYMNRNGSAQRQMNTNTQPNFQNRR